MTTRNHPAKNRRALSAPFPANAKSICSYLLAGPQGYYLRFLAGFYPIPQGRLIRGAQTISSDTLTDTDKGVWEESNRNGKFKEVQIFEALDRNGNIIATSEFVAGDFLHVKPADAFQSLMKKLDLIFPNRAAHNIATIRAVHSHPNVVGRSLISFEDVDAMLRILVVLEYQNIEVNFEESIVFQSLGGAPRKKTIEIAAGSLNFLNGDYSFGVQADRQVRQMFERANHSQHFTLTEE